ncbi:type I-F CRISPR-associated protein Csy1 [Morganella psychrotolerans]|uniref:type I-F CRISPR-associated protein Csy1 n=1 Tax=Morganella psychrotolerans TaxID=368603 RepID=UPI0039AF6E19
MTDPAISAFLAERKTEWLKKKLRGLTNKTDIDALRQYSEVLFSLAQWLPRAAVRAGQISLSTHPCTFTHPSARQNSMNTGGIAGNNTVTAVIAQAKQDNDGFLRSGNIQTEPDALGNAAALDIYRFLMLKMQDNRTLLSHIDEESFLAKSLLSYGDYSVLRKGFLQVVTGKKSAVTSSKVKQVYFPVFDNIAGDNYHLLSVLTPSGILFELCRRIEFIRRSSGDKIEQSNYRNNNRSLESFQTIDSVAIIRFGGSKPQNISVFNNDNAGKACLLLSVPPGFKCQEMQNSVR